MSKPKMLILEDCDMMLENLQIAITRYEVVPAQTIDEALDLLETKNISFIVTDIKLKGSDRGYQLFRRLFSNGKLIPGIVMTGYEVTPAMHKELMEDVGVTEVIQKDSVVDISAAIEDRADEILTDKNEQLIQLTNKVNGCGIMDAPLEGNSGSIRDGLNDISAGKCSIEEENEIIDTIMQACNRLNYSDERGPPPGPAIGYSPDGSAANS